MKDVSPEQLKTAEAEWRKANPGKEPTADDISSQGLPEFLSSGF
jgi:filamentous hemagglutinin